MTPSLRQLLLVILMVFPCCAFAQLSKGVGEMITIPGKTMRCYLPQFFKIQSEPPGVVHKETGTTVFAVKVPANKKVSPEKGLPRSFFDNPGYKILSFDENNFSAPPELTSRGKLYTMLYTVGAYEFERMTLFIVVGQDQYLIIGNYTTKVKAQVLQEVETIMTSFTIR